MGSVGLIDKKGGEMKKEYRVLMRSEIYVEVMAEDEEEAQVLAWERCQENSGNFADWANVEKIEEIGE